VFPRTTFCDPEVARWGSTEQEAAAAAQAVEVTAFSLAELASSHH